MEACRAKLLIIKDYGASKLLKNHIKVQASRKKNFYKTLQMKYDNYNKKVLLYFLNI